MAIYPFPTNRTMASLAPSFALTAAPAHLKSASAAASLSFKPRVFYTSSAIFSLYPLALQCSSASNNNGGSSKSVVVAALAAVAELAEDSTELLQGDDGGATAVASKPKKGKAALPLKRDRVRLVNIFSSRFVSCFFILCVLTRMRFAVEMCP